MDLGEWETQPRFRTPALKRADQPTLRRARTRFPLKVDIKSTIIQTSEKINHLRWTGRARHSVRAALTPAKQSIFYYGRWRAEDCPPTRYDCALSVWRTPCAPTTFP